MNQKQVDLRREALAFTERLMEQYYIRRELGTLSQHMDARISWIGSGNNEMCHNLKEVHHALAQSLEEYRGAFMLEEHTLKVVPCTDTICIVYGTLRAVADDPAIAEENVRLSMVVEKTKHSMKLLHLHVSHPDMVQEEGRYYVPQSARTDVRTLREALDLRSRQLEALNCNIPGGVHQCKNNPSMTLISMSDSFLSMFGYTSEEIETLFHNHFLEMIYLADRAMVHEIIHAQLQKGRTIELEYRVMCKNGTPVWVLNKGRLLEDSEGGENFYCVIIEITARKREQEELRLSLERHQVIMDQVTDVVFEWNIQNDTLSFSPNWYKKFGYDAVKTEVSKRIPLSKKIHSEDLCFFLQLIQNTIAGEPYSETEFRIQHVNEEYYWCRIRATTQFDSDGCPIKALGIITDIDDEKKHKQELLDMALKDNLTGIYNKTTINSLVERRMKQASSSSMQAIFIIDIDYFKQVNDTYGHLAGDSVLSDVAASIIGRIRASDLAGRIGGDEFLVYLPEVASEAATFIKAEELLNALSILTPEPGAPPISCSIGAAVFPHGEMDYYAFYKCADQALYARKNNGRAGVTFYHSDIGVNAVSAEVSPSAVGADIRSNLGGIEDEHLAQYAFRMLYTALDIDSAVNRLLEIIGRSYDVSRVYIFENSEDGRDCSNTFEWCADDIEPQMAALQKVPYSQLGNYLANFNEDGLFYCARIADTHPGVCAMLEPQGIYSMLQCAMLDEGEFVGYVGFDECRNNREWSARQVEVFKLTADVLSSFIVKNKLKKQVKCLREVRQHTL